MKKNSCEVMTCPSGRVIFGPELSWPVLNSTFGDGFVRGYTLRITVQDEHRPA